MPASAEETREEVEGVVRACPAALFVLRDAFVPVLVVDFARFGRGEDVVGFGDGDEFLVRGVVASVCACIVSSYSCLRVRLKYCGVGEGARGGRPW